MKKQKQRVQPRKSARKTKTALKQKKGGASVSGPKKIVKPAKKPKGHKAPASVSRKAAKSVKPKGRKALASGSKKAAKSAAYADFVEGSIGESDGSWGSLG